MPSGWQALPTGVWMMLDDISLLWYLRDMNLCPKLGELEDIRDRWQVGREWVTIEEVARFQLITRIIRAHVWCPAEDEGLVDQGQPLFLDSWFTSRFI